MHMNIVVDDLLLAEARERTGLQSERQVIELALRLLIDLRRNEEAAADAREGASERPSLASGARLEMARLGRH